MQKFCFTLDLINNPTLIGEYEQHHQAVWPEVIKSITDGGILKLEIYRLSTRLVMIMETSDTFSFTDKAASDAANPKVQEWENLMWKYQQALPGAKPGEKWMRMNKIFQL